MLAGSAPSCAAGVRVLPCYHHHYEAVEAAQGPASVPASQRERDLEECAWDT